MSILADIAVAIFSKHPFAECLQASPHHLGKIWCLLITTYDK
jgi:hypothetical protein